MGTLDHPDFLLIDLDPHQCPYDKIVEAALLVKKVHDRSNWWAIRRRPAATACTFMCRSSRSTRTRKCAVRQGAVDAGDARPAGSVHHAAGVSKRQNKVYFDADQISKSKTIAAPYVLRAYDGAPVATPLAWNEVKPGLDPKQFHIRNARARFERRAICSRASWTNPRICRKQSAASRSCFGRISRP